MNSASLYVPGGGEMGGGGVSFSHLATVAPQGRKRVLLGLHEVY